MVLKFIKYFLSNISHSNDSFRSASSSTSVSSSPADCVSGEESESESEDELEEEQINEGIYLKGCKKLSKTSNEDMIREFMVMLDVAKEIIIEQINYYNHEECVDVIDFYSFV